MVNLIQEVKAYFNVDVATFDVNSFSNSKVKVYPASTALFSFAFGSSVSAVGQVELWFSNSDCSSALMLEPKEN